MTRAGSVAPPLPPLPHGPFSTFLADPFHACRSGEDAQLSPARLNSLKSLPLASIAATPAHLYLWVPNLLLGEGLDLLQAWGFDYKSNLVWLRTGTDGLPQPQADGPGFPSVTELILFGVRGRNARTLDPGRSQVNLISAPAAGRGRRPDALMRVIESCSPGPYLDLFGSRRRGWSHWGAPVV